MAVRFPLQALALAISTSFLLTACSDENKQYFSRHFVSKGEELASAADGAITLTFAAKASQ